MLVEVVGVELIVGALLVMMDEDDGEIHGADLDDVLAARCASF